MKIHVPKKLMSKKTGFAAASLVVIAFLVLPVLIFRKHAYADSQGPNSASASGDCTDDAGANGVGSVTWTNPGNAFSNNSTYAQASVDGSTSHLVICKNYGFTIPTGATIDGVVVAVERKSSSTNNGGSKDAAMRIVKNNVIGSTDKSTATTYTTSDVSENHGGATDLWGDTWTDTDINSSNFGAAFAVQKANGGGAAHTVTVDVITITVYYTPAPPPTNPLLFALKGYIWENDDEDYAGGDANDGNSQLAAANTAITVPKGSQVNLRMQVNLSGGDTSGQQFGAFYDRSDGIWSKIGNNLPPKTSSGSGCDDSMFSCSSIDTSNDFGKYSSVAYDPMGNPLVSYYDDTSDDLRVARYVGSGGSGCASSAWNCTTVDSTNDVGSGSSIAIDSSGNPWVSYVDVTNDNLRVAHYVGSGGSCASSAWDCNNAASMGTLGTGNTSITIDSSGKPWVAFRYDHSLDTTWAVMTAHYVGSGGSGCLITSAWNCTTVQLVNQSGENYPSIALDNSGNPWVSLFLNNPQNDLIIAHYVSSGGNCGTGSAWSCTSVDTSDNSGQFSSIAIGADGNPIVSYQQITTVPVSRNLRVAKYVGGGSGNGCSNSDWTCTTVDLVDPNGAYTSIAIDSAGNPWIAYASGDLKIARYVGGGSGNGCSNSDWTCTAMESSSNLGQYSSIAFDSYGRPVVSYYNATGADLRIAKLDDRAGELLISPASGGRWGDSLSESHADMSSVSDTGNRDDADCIGGGTWTNGMLALSENVTQALTDAHCTEITITIDTSQAVVGRTYRIILASNDNWRQDKGMWRGFSSYDQYATITISDSVMRAGKDNTPQFSNCTDTAWGCMTVKSSASDIGKYSSMAIDSEGRPWIAYLDSTNFNVEVSHYVGSGGTGCATSAWECTVVGTDASGPISIVIDSQDSPWLTYFNEAGGDIFSQSLRVYQYTGGSWSVKMDEPATNIVDAQLTFDQKGNPRLLYTDAGSGNITVAHYVGSGGSGCVASPAWTCVTVAVVSAGLGSFASITLDAAGIPWVSYTDGSSKTLSIAHYVGFGGTGCNVSSWTCASVDTSGSVGGYPSIAIDSSDKPWISYYDSSSFDLKVANYIGSGGNCGSGAWNCVSVYTSGIAGTYTSIAMDSIGNPWVSFRGAGLLVARYVTSGGNCGSGAWTCSTVDSTGGVGTYDKIAFDSTGSAWISYYDSTNSDLKVAKTHRPVTPISLNNLYRSRTNNAGQSFARHKLSPGASPNDSSGSCGSSISDYMGVCAWFQNNGQYDTVVAQANEAPTLTMAMRFNDNSKLPTIQWFGRSSYAPNTAGTAGDIVLEVYRYGSTNAWETVASDTSSSDCSAPSAGNCGLSGIPSGTPSDYFYNDGAGGYWVYCRLYQEPNTGGTITFKTDEFNAVRTESRLRHGQFFQDGVSRPLNWR